ncbi:MAG: hypothetical protein ACI3Y9_09645 [Candidatus Cryptobacteroides sp.]
MRSVIYTLAISLTILPLVSCLGIQTGRELGRIESELRSGSADSAALMLSRMERNRMPKAQAARFTVLNAMAADKLYIDDGSLLPSLDSLSEWYVTHGRRRDRMLFWYYYGDQLEDLEKYENAMIPFLKALDFGEKCRDWFYCGMASRELGNILRFYNATSAELDYVRMSYDYFLKAGMERHIRHAKYLTAKSQYNSGYIDDAVQTYEEVIQDSRIANDSLLLSKALSGLAMACLNGREIRVTPEEIYSMLMESKEISGNLDHYGWADLAYVSYLSGHESAVAECFSNAFNACNTTKDTLYVMSRICDVKGVTETEYTSRASALMERMMTDMADNRALVILDVYHQSQAELKKSQMTNAVIISVAVLFFLTIIFLAISLVMMAKGRRNLLVIDELRFKIEELVNTNQGGVVMRYTMSLFEPLFNEYGHGASSNSDMLLAAFEKMLTDFRNEKKPHQKEFIRMVDRSNGCIITSLVNQDVFRAKEILLYSMLVSGLSYYAIAAILAIDNKSVAKRVMRLREKIRTKCDPDTAALLLGRISREF